MSANAKPALFVLENIHVAAPCPVPWDRMTGNDRVRYCAGCNLNVYNISAMTRLEAEELMRGQEGRLCVRFFRRPDGTILTRNCPRGLARLTRRLSSIAAAVLTATMTVGSAFSQALSKNTQQTEENQGNTGIELTVVDPSGALIPGAQVLLCCCKDKTKTDFRTDASGVAHILRLSPGRYSVEIRVTGFKSSRQNIKVQAQKTENVRVKLKLAPTAVSVDVTAAPAEIQGTYVCINRPTQMSFPFPASGVGGRPGPLR